MARNLDLSATLRLNDLISAPMRKIAQQAKAMQQAMTETRKTVQQMQSTLNQANALQKMAQSLRQVQAQIRQTATAEKALAQAIASTNNPTQRQQQALQKLRNTLTQLEAKQASYRAKMSALGQSLQQAGFNTKRFAESQAQLNQRMQTANAKIAQQRAELTRLANAQKAAAQAVQKYNNARSLGSDIKGSGMSAAMAGVAGLYALSKPINESKHFQTESARVASLGLGNVATVDAIKYAKAMKTYGTSTTENLQLIRDGMTAFADEHHAQMVAPILAKMKFANEAMYGAEKGSENEKKFMDMLKVIEMRGGLKSQDAFKQQANIIQQVITATGGRVQPEEWLNTIKTGGVAAKLMDNKAFYYTMEPMVQEMGGHRTGTAMMSAYQNLYQGRTTKRAMNNLDKFNLIADKSKVQHDKVGQTAQMDIGAIKGADLFRSNQFAWMEKVLIPAINAKGITEERDVMDAIGSIFSNRTASNLFAQMYMQRQQIHKNTKFNEGADGIEQLNEKAKGTAAGQELEAKAKMHDALLELGNAILPTYTAALKTATSAMQGMASIMQQYPNLTKAIGIGLLVIVSAIVMLGGLAVIIGSVLGPLALIRFSLTALSSIGAGGQIFGGLITAFNTLRTAIMGMGIATTLNPIGLAIMAIAVLAVVLIKYWQPIKAFFQGLWQGISAGLQPALTALQPVINALQPILSSLGDAFTNLLTPLHFSADTLNIVKAAGAAVGFALGSLISIIANVVMAFLNITSQIASVPMGIIALFADLPNHMSNMGGYIMDGLKNGIMSRAESVLASIRSIASSIKSAFTGMMGIHSPSRVFAGYGDYMMQGLNNGLLANTSPIQAMIRTSDNIRNAMDTSQIRFDSRKPISASMLNSSNGNAQSTAPITINIYPQPNQSPQDIANLVAVELAKARLGTTQPNNTALYDHAEAW